MFPVGFAAQRKACNAAKSAVLCLLLHISSKLLAVPLECFYAAGKTSALKDAFSTGASGGPFW